jgi:membrane protein DedA with SNARE-associated domain
MDNVLPNDITHIVIFYITELIKDFGYIGLFVGMTLESACIPISSEVLLLFSGFMVDRGILNFWAVVFAGVFGNLVGSILTYIIGENGGRSFLLKYGKYMFINREHIEKSEYYFQKYGEVVVFIGRNLPIVRTFISLPAGIARMNFMRFVVFSFLGCIPWNIALTYIGVKLGKNWSTLEDYTFPFSVAIVVLLVVLVIRHYRKNRVIK